MFRLLWKLVKFMLFVVGLLLAVLLIVVMPITLLAGWLAEPIAGAPWVPMWIKDFAIFAKFEVLGSETAQSVDAVATIQGATTFTQVALPLFALIVQAVAANWLPIAGAVLVWFLLANRKKWGRWLTAMPEKIKALPAPAIVVLIAAVGFVGYGFYLGDPFKLFDEIWGIAVLAMLYVVVKSFWDSSLGDKAADMRDALMDLLWTAGGLIALLLPSYLVLAASWGHPVTPPVGEGVFPGFARAVVGVCTDFGAANNRYLLTGAAAVALALWRIMSGRGHVARPGQDHRPSVAERLGFVPPEQSRHRR